jgi:S-adenosylmethionine hydrolase
VSTPVVTLLTDYGTESEFAGICHGVIKRICPDATIVDITHAIPRHDVRHGAIVLRDALPYMPVGVHVGVVDPQVGTERRAVAVRSGDGRLLVGPDNGLLSLAWERAGGAVEAVDVSRSQHRLQPVSATFHGRDLFAPVAAALARGEELADAGEPIDAGSLTVLELPQPRRERDVVIAHVLIVDRFGNVVLDLRHEDLPDTGLVLGSPVEVSAGARTRWATFTATFADVPAGEMLLYEDATRSLALAVNRGSASDVLRVGPDDQVRLVPL